MIVVERTRNVSVAETVAVVGAVFADAAIKANLAGRLVIASPYRIRIRPPLPEVGTGEGAS